MTLDLHAHFSQFREAAPGRIHLAAHSHHYWPDAACEAHRQAVADAARLADGKWEKVFGEVIPRAQRGIAALLALPDPATIAFAPNTHEFVLRLLSSLPLRPLRILTSDSEFHSFSRQIARLEEDSMVSVERIAAEPFDNFAARFAAAARRGGHDLVFVSHVFFNSAATAGAITDIVEAVSDAGALIVIDGYHGFMALPTDLSRICRRAFYLAGGYKYAMAGEGACFLHCPPGQAKRPRDTGWFAEFGALSGRDAHKVAYGGDGSRFMGATFDPSGLYRLAATLDWMRSIGLTVDAIHAHVMQLQKIFLDEVKRRGVKPLSDARLVTPVGAAVERGHFLAFETGAAAAIHDRLARANIVTDRRGERIRFGFGCYHTENDIAAAAHAVARALA
jgi:selenocysteine lyase/cysteine desulfurase